jgi:flavodoxin
MCDIIMIFASMSGSMKKIADAIAEGIRKQAKS